ncbi:MAG: hypothetical protein ABI847_02375 [Anaerolineales bacterium]
MQMLLGNTAGASVSRLAVVAGVVQLVGLLSLIVFFVIGEPFGTLNDLCIALTGILSAALAWQLFAAFPARSPALGWLVVALAGVGALIVVAGSELVITRTTGWVLAGLWMEFGYALIGVWLLVFCLAAPAGADWPRGLTVLGLVAGGLMLLGCLTLPGLLRGLDAWEALPWYVNVGQAGSLGWLLLYPLWCLWLGRVLAVH